MTSGLNRQVFLLGLAELYLLNLSQEMLRVDDAVDRIIFNTQIPAYRRAGSDEDSFIAFGK